MTDEEQTGSDPDEPEYLFVVRYDEDAERKRVEYLFNNLDTGTIDTPDGLTRFVQDIDHDELYEQLVSKVPEDQVRSYRLEPIETDMDPETVVVEQSIDAAGETVDAFVEYMFSKKKAVLQSAARNEYEVYTKKGRAEVSYRLDEENGTSTVTVHVTGYPPAPAFLADFFRTELEEYATSQA